MQQQQALQQLAEQQQHAEQWQQQGSGSRQSSCSSNHSSSWAPFKKVTLVVWQCDFNTHKSVDRLGSCVWACLSCRLWLLSMAAGHITRLQDLAVPQSWCMTGTASNGWALFRRSSAVYSGGHKSR